LAAELVAGESEELDVLGVLRLEFLVKLLETLELRGKTALGGGVDGEDDLAFQGGEGKGCALLCLRGSVLVGCFFFFQSLSRTAARDAGTKNGGVGAGGGGSAMVYILSTGSNSKKVVAEDMVLVWKRRGVEERG
jgi:hypothetical protein